MGCAIMLTIPHVIKNTIQKNPIAREAVPKPQGHPKLVPRDQIFGLKIFLIPTSDEVCKIFDWFAQKPSLFVIWDLSYSVTTSAK